MAFKKGAQRTTDVDADADADADAKLPSFRKIPRHFPIVPENMSAQTRLDHRLPLRWQGRQWTLADVAARMGHQLRLTDQRTGNGKANARIDNPGFAAIGEPISIAELVNGLAVPFDHYR